VIAPDVLELAENANTYTPLGPTDERIVTDPYVLWMGRGNEPGWNVAQRFRFRADELPEVRDEIHRILRERGRTACSWEVGSNATPDDLVERLHALGLVDDSPDPLAIGMVLTAPPAEAPPADIEVRRVGTPAERLEAERIAAIAFEAPEPRSVPAAPPDPERHHVTYLAYIDGTPAPRRRSRSTA
jgi:hypothetical protein